MTEVHVVLPNDIDDPATPSGGNGYDRRLCRGLAAAGWSVHEHPVRGAWPRPGGLERAGLARVLAGLPDGAVVLFDGLVASAVPEVLRPQAARLRLVVLVHMPLANPTERDALASAAAIVTPSTWSRGRLLDLYPLAPDRIHIAPPGVDLAPVALGSAAGSALLCVGAVTPHKGHDVLVEALASVPDLPWTCVCAGALDRESAGRESAGRDTGFVDLLRQRVEKLEGRIHFVGPCTGGDLAARYAAADLLVHPSRGETYGMVVTEALARGTPVLGTAVGGLPEALGRAPDGSRPGILVPPGDPAALAGALRRWFRDPELRRRLRSSARGRRTTLTGWETTAATVARILAATGAAVPVRTGGTGG